MLGRVWHMLGPCWAHLGPMLGLCWAMLSPSLATDPIFRSLEKTMKKHRILEKNSPLPKLKLSKLLQLLLDRACQQKTPRHPIQNSVQIVCMSIHNKSDVLLGGRNVRVGRTMFKLIWLLASGNALGSRKTVERTNPHWPDPEVRKRRRSWAM